ncbi:FUSC family protein [Nocardia cyriacigeorgica]|uniref:FUSC family protein n=1 Tax=Nocardia cyriacigeorgica TaxID=135487 RepID=UPI0018962793|nr:FUSC family protein [Nocardia cyriacigeorgica]MBF6321968.1 FUSC family protein [Nocardia cyriacigeorgica]MBF6497694.1 FUSC family protein [Nocardia cyriacigeorgica]
MPDPDGPQRSPAESGSPKPLSPAPDGPNLPAPAPARAVLFGVPPAGRRLPGAVRTALAFGAPALIAALLGHEQQGLIAALGSFAVIFGEGRVYRQRWRAIGWAGLGLIAAACAGGFTGAAIHRHTAAGSGHAWLLVLVVVLAAVAVISTFVNSALRLGPPGGFFFVLAVGIGAAVTGAGVSPGAVALWASAGAVSAMVVGMSGALRYPRAPEDNAVAAAVDAVRAYDGLERTSDDLAAARYTAGMKIQTAWTMLDGARRTDPSHPPARTLAEAQARFAEALHRNGVDDADALFDTGRPAPTPFPSLRFRLARSLSPDSHAAVAANRIGLAAILAGSLTVALSIGRPDWAVLTVAVLLHQGPDRVRGTYRGIHRVGGTVLGLAVFTVIYAFEPRGFALVLVLMGLQFSIELFVARNYGLAVVFITPLALLMGGGGVYGDPLPVAFDRFLESVIGVLIGLGVLWLVDRHSHRRVLLRNDRRVIASLDRLLDALRTDPGRVPETRKELEFELMGSTLAEIDAAHNEPAWARTQWPRHERIRQLGHRVLAATWNLGPDRPADPARLARWTDSVAGLR